MADNSCYSVMLCFTDYIEFLYYVRFCGMLAFMMWEGRVGGWPLLYNFKEVGKTVI